MLACAYIEVNYNVYDGICVDEEKAARVNKFALANAGFFRVAAVRLGTGPAWHNYALCRMLAYRDYTNAEELFVLADRMADTRLQLACSQQMMTVREDTSSWFALVGVASVAAAGVLVLAGKVRLA